MKATFVVMMLTFWMTNVLYAWLAAPTTPTTLSFFVLPMTIVAQNNIATTLGTPPANASTVNTVQGTGIPSLVVVRPRVVLI